MVNLTLVVDNSANISHHVLKNLESCDGKLVSTFHAIRNIGDTSAALDALKTLIKDGLIERREIGPQRLAFYRYRSELAFYRDVTMSKSTQAV